MLNEFSYYSKGCVGATLVALVALLRLMQKNHDSVKSPPDDFNE